MNKTKTINIRINSADKKFLMQAAKTKRQSLSAFIRESIENEARKILEKQK